MGLIVGVGAGVPFGGAKTADLNDIAGGPFAWWNLQWLAGITFNGPDVAAIQGYKGTVHNLATPGGPGTQPVYEPNGMGAGQPSCQFDGISEYMQANTVAPLLQGDDTPFTWLMVCQPLAALANKYLAAAVRANFSGQGSHRILQSSVAGKLRNYRADDAAAVVTADTVQLLGLTPHVIAIVFSAPAGTGVVSVYFDGVLTSVNATPMEVGAMTLFWYTVAALSYNVGPTVTGWMNLRLAEHAIWSIALSGPEVAQASTILKGRWTGLP